jgi:hypothetical protein
VYQFTPSSIRDAWKPQPKGFLVPLLVLWSAAFGMAGARAPGITDFERQMLAEDVSAKVRSESRILKGADMLLAIHGTIRNGDLVPTRTDLPPEILGRIAFVDGGFQSVARKSPDGTPFIMISGGTWNGVMFLCPMRYDRTLWTWASVMVFSKTTNELLLMYCPAD